MVESLEMTYRFAVPIQIKMCDLDPFAHVNNGVQCNYFDYGRSRYFESVFGEKIDWLSMDMVLVHTELDFKSPIKVHDDIVCETAIYHIGNKSISMIQQLRSREEGSVKTICKSVLSGFDRTTESSAPIQEKYKEAIRNFEKL
ncbi:MAG: acyl-CoA thioesterase [Bacteroidales bacterium]|nr:acyl-CoA thioesterase [Bacteroidales bacterium]